MLIGVVSDTHNNLKNIDKIISIFNHEEVDLVVHTGDITSSKSLERFEHLNCELFGVYGNNDRNEPGLQEIAEKLCFKIQNPPYLFNIQNKCIVIFHEPDTVDDFLSKNDEVDILLHGHTHRYREEYFKGTLIFNPGESAGMQKDKNAVGIIDLNNLNVRRIFF